MKRFAGWILMLCLVSGLRAAVIHVPGDQPDIQAGIEAARNGDIVIVADGRYPVPEIGYHDFLGKAITVTSENGPEHCVVDGRGVGRGFVFQNNETWDSVLEGFRIENGILEGAGVYCKNASPVIRNCVIQGNIVDACDIYGVGILCENSLARIENCRIIENQALGCDIYGVGICALDSSITVCKTLVADNKGLLNQDVGWGYGGGIYGDDITITCSVIRDNDLGYPGGTDINVYGGGVYGGNLGMYNCLVTGNNARSAGNGMGVAGGIYCLNGTLMNVTVSDNQAGTENNGIMGSSSSFKNMIIVDASSLISSTVIYSDVIGGCVGEGNIDADPLFVQGPLGDYYLSQTVAGQPVDSPCVDAGADQAPSTCFENCVLLMCMDMLSTRVDEAVDDGTVDMGYHYQAMSVEPTPTPECASLGCSILMPTNVYHEGDSCYCDVGICNPDDITYPALLLIVVLEVDSAYYYLPGNFMDVDPGFTTVSIIPEFTWPSGVGNGSGVFYAGLVDRSFSLVGMYDQFRFRWK